MYASIPAGLTSVRVQGLGGSGQILGVCSGLRA